MDIHNLEQIKQGKGTGKTAGAFRCAGKSGYFKKGGAD